MQPELDADTSTETTTTQGEMLASGRPARLFTQHDIDMQHVMYLDDVGEERRDEYLKLRVVAGNLQVHSR